MPQHVRSTCATLDLIRNIALQNRVSGFLALLTALLERCGVVMLLSWPYSPFFFLFRLIAWAVWKYSGHCISGDGCFPGCAKQDITTIDSFPGFVHQICLEVSFAEMVSRLQCIVWYSSIPKAALSAQSTKVFRHTTCTLPCIVGRNTFSPSLLWLLAPHKFTRSRKIVKDCE